MSRRCVPFSVNKATIEEIQAQTNLQWADFVKAVNNIEILANINGVGTIYIKRNVVFPASQCLFHHTKNIKIFVYKVMMHGSGCRYAVPCVTFNNNTRTTVEIFHQIQSRFRKSGPPIPKIYPLGVHHFGNVR